MSDNYYRFFPGDYHRDTGDLTLDKSQDLGYMYRHEVRICGGKSIKHKL